MTAALLSLNCFPRNYLQKRPFPWSHNPNISPRASFILNSSQPNRTVGSLLSFLAPLDAILFDIDGTLCDSDPLHYYAFRDMLQELGFNGGEPITEEFFIEKISGKHNEQLCGILLPEWDFERAMKFMDDKEARFRSLAAKQLEPVSGLTKLCKWIEDRGLKTAAVTNAPKPNADLLITMLGLTNFFEIVVLAEECERVKPFPDPYLKALKALNVLPEHTFVFEDSVSGIKAGIAAGMPVIGLAMRNPEKLLTEAGATFVIKNFNDPQLWAALEELEKKGGYMGRLRAGLQTSTESGHY